MYMLLVKPGLGTLRRAQARLASAQERLISLILKLTLTYKAEYPYLHVNTQRIIPAPPPFCNVHLISICEQKTRIAGAFEILIPNFASTHILPTYF